MIWGVINGTPLDAVEALVLQLLDSNPALREAGLASIAGALELHTIPVGTALASLMRKDLVRRTHQGHYVPVIRPNA